MLNGFVVVYRASGLGEAQLIQGYLESEGIPCELDYESAGAIVYPLTMNGLGEVRVRVEPDMVEAATLALARRPGLQPEDTDEGSGPDAA